MLRPTTPCRHDRILCTRDAPCADCTEDVEVELARINAHLWDCTVIDCWRCQYARTVGATIPKPANL